MNKEYITKFLDVNEGLLINTINELEDFNGDAESREQLVKEYGVISERHINGIKQLNDVESIEESNVIEYEKINVAHEDLMEQQKQAIYTDVMNTSKEILMQFTGMIFYTVRFREGLRFNIDNYVSDDFVRGLVQKLPDFMKSRK